MAQNPSKQRQSAVDVANDAIRALALSIGRRAWTTAELARYAALNDVWLAAAAECHDEAADAETVMILAA